MLPVTGPTPEEAYALEERLRRRDRRRIATAFAVAALLHGGTAFAIAYSRPPEAVEPPGEMMITIDLAPAEAEMETAAPAGVTSAAVPETPEPETEEPVEEVVEETPAEPVEEVVEQETPPEPPQEVAEIPPEPVVEPPPEPEPLPEPVVEPPPEPVPEPPPPVVDTPPPPPAKEAEVVMPPPPPPRAKIVRERPKVEKPKPETVAEKPVRRQERPKAKAPPPSSSAAGGASSRQKSDVAGSGARANPSEINRWTGRLRANIERRKRKPSGAVGGATVYVRFTINASGQISSPRIVRPSGNAAYDQAALAAVVGASGPSMPEGMPSPQVVGVPIRFDP